MGACDWVCVLLLLVPVVNTFEVIEIEVINVRVFFLKLVLRPFVYYTFFLIKLGLHLF